MQRACFPRTKMAVMDGARLSTTFVSRLEQNLTTALQRRPHHHLTSSTSSDMTSTIYRPTLSQKTPPFII